MQTPFIDELEENTDNETRFVKKISLVKLYLVLMLLVFSVIYFYSVYNGEYLSIFVPLTKIWPIAVILVGISIFQVHNTASFSLGFFIVVSLVSITISTIFLQSGLIKSLPYTSLTPISDINRIDTKINLILSQSVIEASNINVFRADSISNYDNVRVDSYKNDSSIADIVLNHNKIPSGLGSYSKNTKIIFPNSIPASLGIKSRFSGVEANLKGLKVSNSSFDIVGSNLNIIITDIEQNSSLNIISTLSQVNLIVDDNIDITFASSALLTKKEVIGLSPSIVDPLIYKSNNIDKGDLQQTNNRPELIVNLTSTMSTFKITQKDL